MRQRSVVDVLALLSEAVHRFADLDRVPVQNGIRDQAEAAGFVHDLYVVSGCKLALIRKEDPTRELLPVLALVELSLNGASQLRVREIPQNVFATA